MKTGMTWAESTVGRIVQDGDRRVGKGRATKVLVALPKYLLDFALTTVSRRMSVFAKSAGWMKALQIEETLSAVALRQKGRPKGSGRRWGQEDRYRQRKSLPHGLSNSADPAKAVTTVQGEGSVFRNERGYTKHVFLGGLNGKQTKQNKIRTGGQGAVKSDLQHFEFEVTVGHLGAMCRE